jgi:hypothetical protein
VKSTPASASLSETASAAAHALKRFTLWLAAYGETSWDHQSYFAGSIGGRAKALYYRNPKLGLLAVAPMIFSEALVPSARRLFHQRIRFPIADAHYAMGFAFLHEATGNSAHLERAIHFLLELQKSRAQGFEEYCWGYPFDWVTRNGVMARQTPLITSTPYMWEAFLQVHRIAPRAEWRDVLESIARHASNDIKDFPTSNRASSCSYSPFDKGGVINAAAYRSFLLTSASRALGVPEYGVKADRNLRFVLENQSPDGSWPYAVDGVRGFVDHFHTCFVMKALAKIHAISGDAETLEALRKGVAYYLANLFGPGGMPKPFSRAPRMTMYKCELYDCAESINLCLLLRDHFPELEKTLRTVASGIMENWIKPDGSFRSRKLHFGWDNVPMHRWAQSQMFRSLAFLLAENGSQKLQIRSHGTANQRGV